MSVFDILRFVRGKKNPLKARGQRPRSRWQKTILNLERLEDRTVPTTITQTQTFGPDFTDLVNQSLSPPVQQFDTQGGYRILDSVQIQASSSVIASLSGAISNPTNSNQDFQFTATVTNTATSVNGPGLALDFVSNSAASLLSFDSGPQTLAAHASFTIPAQSQTLTATGSVTLTNPADLAPFIGTGTFNYTTSAHAAGTTNLNGSGNLDDNSDLSTQGQAAVTVTYDFHLATPALQIVKLTNGTNNDATPGLHVPAGTPITWTYNVTANGSNVDLANVSVTDNVTGVNPTPVTVGGFNIGDTNSDGKLQAGETWVFTASGTAITGQYSNIGTAQATAVDANGNPIVNPNVPSPITATNQDNYFGDNAAIQIVKLTNGTNNDAAPGLHVVAGTPITWTYNVTNPGNVPIDTVTVTDNQGVTVTPVLSGAFNVGDSNTNGLLDQGETWVFTGSGTAVTDQYSNIGTANGFDSFIRTPVSASNPDNYFGDNAQIQIVKLTNGTNNDSAPGLHVAAGSAIDWTYLVTNPGNVPIANVAVTDNQGVTVTPFLSGVFNVGDSNSDGLLDPNETWVFTASGTAVAGQYTNIGTATGTDAFVPSNTVSASDPDNYFGDDPKIQIVKLTNGTNNNSAPGVHVLAGSTVTWTYNVTATGSNVPLTNVTVTDNKAGVNPTPVTVGGFNVGDSNTNGLLDAGETWVFTASGTAVAGQYTNIGTATGTDSFDPGNFDGETEVFVPGQTVSATDPDNYFGDNPGISINKLINGKAAATAPGVPVLVGSTITFTYVVSNTGNVPLSGVVLNDNVLGLITTFTSSDGNKIQLDVGATWTFTTTAKAIAGQHANTGTVSAHDGPIPPKIVTAKSTANYVSQFGSLSGFSYIDSNNDGIKQANEIGLGGVLITLIGTNSQGQLVSTSVRTATDGSYHFNNLQAGNYRIIEAPLLRFLRGKQTIGSNGGVTLLGQFLINLLSGVNGVNNNFAHLLSKAFYIGSSR